MLCQESFNSIDALCHLMPGVCRSQMRLFLALTHLPRLREYLKVYKRCERLLLFNADCPTGRYALNMSVPSDYAVAEMLKMLDAWEASMAKEAGLQDRSQHGNWSSVRNCTYLNQSLLSLTDCLLPNHETLRLDFVTWRRPKDARALPADRWEGMMVHLSQVAIVRQTVFMAKVLDTSRYEDRIAASLVVRMNMKESKRLGNIRNPSLVLIGGNQFQFDRGVPAGWTNTSAIPQGTLRLQYMCAPEDHLIDFRYELLAQYGGWQADPKAKIIWWAYLQAVPEPVVTFLIHVLRHFRDDLRAAFQMIDGQADTGNGKLTLREFKLAVASLGWKEFMDPERATQIFRYLDPDRGGTISYAEWQVMEEFLKELQLSILELLQHVYCTFGSVEVAHDFLDKDGSSSVDEEEWAQATKEMGYFGPSGIIYKYLCADQVQGQTSGLTKERWQKAVDIWTRRKIIFQRILG
ncbi:unnamed protein product [Effrenium voratum]|nr:unnamed protein product [Effrenium voratum]